MVVRLSRGFEVTRVSMNSMNKKIYTEKKREKKGKEKEGVKKKESEEIMLKNSREKK